MLCTWQGLVSASGHYIDPFSQRVLELPSCYEAQYVRGIVPCGTADLGEDVLHLVQRSREEEDGLAEQSYLWLDLADEPLGALDIYVHVLLVKRVVESPDPAHPSRAYLRMGYVTPVGECDRRHLITGLGQRHENGHVGYRARCGPDISESAGENLTGQILANGLNLIDIDVALVVPLPGQALSVSVAEVRVENLPCGRAHNILGRDQRDGILEPCTVFAREFPHGLSQILR